MYTYEAKLVRVVDGDTIDVTIDLGFDVSVKKKGYEKVITKKGGKIKTKLISEKKAARQIERKRKKAYSEAEHFKASDYYKEERKKHDAEYGEGSFDKQFQ